MKRALDVAGALLGLLILCPVIAAAMIAIRLETPGTALFAQARVGRGGRSFTCYKLRTMHRNTKELPSHEVGAAALTSVGGILRRFKLDELPQLYNVLIGEMSLVGPRPCLPSQTELIEARRREGALDVRPGITGLAQVQGLDMSDPQLLAAVDGEYARTRSLAGDILLILRTATGAGLRVDAARSGDKRLGGGDRKGRAL